MISLGFSARHWQQIEAGRPITMTTLLRICDVFKVRAGWPDSRAGQGHLREVKRRVLGATVRQPCSLEK